MDRDRHEDGRREKGQHRRDRGKQDEQRHPEHGPPVDDRRGAVPRKRRSRECSASDEAASAARPAQTSVEQRLPSTPDAGPASAGRIPVWESAFETWCESTIRDMLFRGRIPGRRIYHTPDAGSHIRALDASQRAEGTTMRTAIGLVRVDEVAVVDDGGDIGARRRTGAGFASAEPSVRPAGGGGHVYRTALTYAGPDPRIRLRNEALGSRGRSGEATRAAVPQDRRGQQSRSRGRCKVLLVTPNSRGCACRSANSAIARTARRLPSSVTSGC